MPNSETEPQIDKFKKFALACLAVEEFLIRYQTDDQPPEAPGITTPHTRTPYTSCMNLNPGIEQGKVLMFDPESFKLYLLKDENSGQPEQEGLITLTRNFGTESGPAQTLKWVKEIIYALIVHYTLIVSNPNTLQNLEELDSNTIEALKQLLSIMRTTSQQHEKKQEAGRNRRYDLTINILSTIIQLYFW